MHNERVQTQGCYLAQIRGTMGSGPSKPTEAQRAQLKTDYEDLCKAAAKCIHDADVLVVCTGAGFSADSGLAVYVDIANCFRWVDLKGLRLVLLITAL